MYTVKKLADLAGVTARTIRYYDQIDLLKPSQMTESGYRNYNSEDVDRLQQILFYRELGVSLDEIKKIISDSNYDKLQALAAHKDELLASRMRIDTILALLDESIKYYKGDVKMSDQEKFEALKQTKIAENDTKYGDEVVSLYGADVYAQSNKKFAAMTEKKYEQAETLAKVFIQEILVAYKTGNPESEEAMKAINTHKKWLMYYWPKYNKQAHVALGNMYVSDERFKKYYDQHQEGLSEFIRLALNVIIK
jgi:DNA-binding transcriptional MerR regulator